MGGLSRARSDGLGRRRPRRSPCWPPAAARRRSSPPPRTSASKRRPRVPGHDPVAGADRPVAAAAARRRRAPKPTAWWSTTCACRTCCSRSRATPSSTSTSIPGITGTRHAERDRPDAAATARAHRQAGGHALRARRPDLVVMRDTPYLRIYKMDYVNMQRDTQKSGAPRRRSAAPARPAARRRQLRAATTRPPVDQVDLGNNQFWDTLVQNIKDILRETDKIVPAAGAAPAAPAQAAAPAAPARRSLRRAPSAAALGRVPRGRLGHRQPRERACSASAPPRASTRRSRNSSTRCCPAPSARC